ncbi:hypothetical protein XfCFBP8082_03920 [Xylella fastidiosa subsp. fastidiosa]|uniref:tyrosine-type recombinase/integrase n=1 Tax=Xylella fastidiosa TaxID=2371 RepID=UPI000FFE8A59|nr:tyrosine-type recombinase/integrase [Xylella fastidiosa]MDC7963919.1 tyrosine-type recombinase/integrase [Xylella fastidiosa]RWA41424.1 hypothetical protein XfCFBP8082_03920 [Xylella fastidiosa subsp. fastidiosa]
MGRRRKRNKHLPQSMFFQHGAYYFVASGKWLPLGKEYGAALGKYAVFVGKKPTVDSVKDMVWGYIEAKRPKLSAKTIEGYERNAANLCAVFGHLRPDEIETSDIFRYLTTKGNVQANRDKALLSASYSWHRLGGYKGSDPTKRLQYRNEEKPRDRYVEDVELNSILAKASHKLSCIATFLELTGMRQGDALRVKLADLDDNGFIYWNSKSKKKQGLHRSDALTACIERARELWRRENQVWLFESHPKGKHSKRGIGPYTPSGLRAMWRVARAKAGLSDVRLHDLRAKAGSDRETVEEAQQVLGHSDAKVTQRHYRRRMTRVNPTR